jgi:hypothetical protein
MNGRGPAFLLGVGGAPSGVIDISQSQVDAQGWRGQKTPWAVRWPLVVSAVVTLALGAVSVGSAREEGSRARTPRGVELHGNASCDSVIDQRQAPDFSTVLFNRVGMWPQESRGAGSAERRNPLP